MMKFDIKHDLRIDRNHYDTLAKQLQRQLMDLIYHYPAGTRLPSERQLAAELNISRVTVRRVLNELSDQGKIIRKGARGTFVAKEGNFSPNTLHPIQLEQDTYLRANSMTPLNFISFETYPQQRRFWSETIRLFNEHGSGKPVILNELPQNVCYSAYPQYIIENGFDLIMLQSREKVFDDILEPLPRSILKKLDSADYIFKDFGASFQVSVPIKSTPLMIFWNKKMASDLGIENIPERIQRGEILELHREAAEKMPKGSCAGGHLWDYFSVKGLPEGIPELDMDFLQKRLAEFEQFSGKPEMFICEQEYSFEVADRFNKGELLFASGFALFYCPPNIPFEIGAMFLTPDPGHTLYREAIYLGVYKNSPSKKAAFDFIDFILSETPQNLLLTHMWDSPCLKKVALRFSELLDNTDSTAISEYYHRSPFPPGERDLLFSRQYHFLVHDIRDILYALMHGRVNSKRAAATILKRWRKLPENKAS
ncbi:MAG: extracellular solute-binding protein [Oligosphaeraceae bacterium]|nr:extracellular solute-binding protein [Oligosphaeraceae bacterium]